MSKIKILQVLFVGFISFFVQVTVTQANDIDYQIFLNGHKLDQGQKALKVSEFAPIIIRLSKRQNKIHRLKVTLARGDRPVDVKKASGNQFNLGKFKRVARSGDRIVFEIYTEKNIHAQDQPYLVIAIPVI